MKTVGEWFEEINKLISMAYHVANMIKVNFYDNRVERISCIVRVDIWK